MARQDLTLIPLLLLADEEKACDFYIIISIEALSEILPETTKKERKDGKKG